MMISLRQRIRFITMWSFVALLISVAMAPASAHALIDLALKTDIPGDPYQNDGVSFRVICYHDVRDHLRETMKDWPELGALDTYDLIQQFSWLKENGYHPVSLDAIIEARNGGEKLLPRSVLLTFDDGYRSMYTRVFPLLKLYGYPAVIGLVGEWLEDTEDGQVLYGDRWIARDNFVTWPQVREMEASGLVEVASHSYGLHKGATSNLQSAQPPSAITRILNFDNMQYESDADYYARIRADLARNSALIAHHTGTKPRVMIWPYGAYNMTTVHAAHEEGMPMTMTLDSGPNSPDHPLTRIRREMMLFHDKVTDLKRNLHLPAQYGGDESPLNRVVGVDLASLYDPDPKQQERNVGVLVERIFQLRVNMVYLWASADLNHNGEADALYFPNRHLPMRSDLLNRIAWQLRTRGTLPPHYVRVYVALPITKFELSGQVGEKIKNIYEDAAKNAPLVDGIVFDDTPARLRETVASHHIHQNGHAAEDQSLVSMTRDLAKAFRVHQPNALTVRKVSEMLETGPRNNDEWREEFTRLTKHYDFVMVSTMVDDRAINDECCLDDIIDRIADIPDTLQRTIFELSTVTRASHESVPSRQLANKLRMWQQNGARNFGYFPDDALKNYPSLAVLKPVLSLKTNPSHTR
jgi:biofilm PGA synthesis lipoprotein PgaB